MFNSGQSIEMFKIIENDLIEYLRCVPLKSRFNDIKIKLGEKTECSLNDIHLNVYSPILADLLLRACTQIEIFFKEWVKLEEFDNKEDTVSMREMKGVMGKMQKYVKFIDTYKKIKSETIRILPLEEEINPFKDFTDNEVPEWWTANNKTKHDGFKEMQRANLKNVLFSLSALFLLHCLNRHNVKTALVNNYMTEVTDFGIAQINGNMEKIGSPALRVIRTPKYYGYYLFEWKQKLLCRPPPPQ